MNVRFISTAILVLPMLMVSSLTHAEVHKYKDANGGWVYSDVAPSPNIKQETLGAKVKQSTSVAPLSKVVDAVPTSPAKSPLSKDQERDQAAAKRQRTAEQEKSNKAVKDSQDKAKEDNCRAAKANLATYTQGGRIFKTNEKGERDYMDDKAINESKAQSQKEVEANCN